MHERSAVCGARSQRTLRRATYAPFVEYVGLMIIPAWGYSCEETQPSASQMNGRPWVNPTGCLLKDGEPSCWWLAWKRLMLSEDEARTEHAAFIIIPAWGGPCGQIPCGGF